MCIVYVYIILLPFLYINIYTIYIVLNTQWVKISRSISNGITEIKMTVISAAGFLMKTTNSFYSNICLTTHENRYVITKYVYTILRCISLNIIYYFHNNVIFMRLIL